ncbi:MAG TPA: VWA domain-containing protein [Thermoanaerobaculia bacterium]|nr:VWA domain-containing protein [Thermoanaerobaculia bacterium]
MKLGAPDLLWLAALAPLGALAAWWSLRRRAADEARWIARGLWPRLRPGGLARPVAWALLPALALAATAAGLARPRWGERTEAVERQGVDVVFVLDTSLSMAVVDVTPSRLWVAQSLLRRLAAALPGNRLALVQAEGTGVVLVPLTVDAAAIDLVLDGLEAGSAPVAGTRLTPALERALALFPEGSQKHRAMIVVSDGEIHGESLTAIAERLREAGVIVHTIAVGTPSGGPVPDGGTAGGYKRDRQGRVVVSRADPEALARLASATGGEALQALSAATNPEKIAARVREMERRAVDGEVVTTLAERFQWPLALGAVLLLAALVRTPFAPRPAGKEER